MTDYTKLVDALRILQDKNSLSYYKRQVCKDAADAIEKLVTLYEKAEMDATNLTGKLAQAEAQLPKLGEWVEDTTTYAGPGLSNYKCSLCGKICGTWRSGLKPSELPNWCGNCGADMRKMEVQDG